MFTYDRIHLNLLCKWRMISDKQLQVNTENMLIACTCWRKLLNVKFQVHFVMHIEIKFVEGSNTLK